MKRLLSLLLLTAFAVVGWAESVTFTPGTVNGTASGSTQGADSMTSGAVTVSTTKGQFGRTTDYRVYSGGEITFTVNGADITSVVITAASGYNVSTLSGTGYTEGTWSGSASSVTLTASAQVRLSSIVVTYEGSATVITPGDVTFSPGSGEVFAGTAVTLQSVNASSIHYTTNGTNPTEVSDYLTISGSSGTVTVNEACTLTAVGVASDGTTMSNVTSASYTISTAQAQTYSLVSSISSSDVGKQFLLVCESKNAAMGEIGTYGASVGVTISDHSTAITNQAVVPVTLGLGSSDGEWTLKTDDGKYLSWSSNNTLNASTSEYAWTITFDGDNVYIASVGTPDRKIRYNSGSPRFACYTSAQTDIQLYALDAGTQSNVAAPTISLSPEGPYWEGDNVTVTLSSATENAVISYSLDNGNTWTQGTTFTLSSTTTIQAKATLNSEESSTVTQTVTFGPVVNSIAAIKALDVNTQFKFVGTVTALGKTSNNVYVQDGNSGILLYTYGLPDYVLGDVITSGFIGTRANYNGAPEVINITGIGEAASNTVPEPVEVALSEVTFDNFSRYAVIRGASFDGNNLVVGNDVLAYYNSLMTESAPTDGGMYDVYGVCGWYNGAQFLPISWEAAGGEELSLQILPAVYDNTQPVTVTITPANATGDVVITYTTDGTDPSSNNAQTYTEPFTLYNSATVKAYAIDSRMRTATAEREYSITLNDFTITPSAAPGTYYEAQSVTFTPENGIEPLEITYTVTNEDGTTNGEATGAFTVNIDKTTTVEIVAQDAIGRTFEGTFAYTIDTFTPATQFRLVTSLDELETGKQIILAGVKANDGVYVMNTTGTTNRQSVAINDTGVLPAVIDNADGYDVLVLGASGNYYTLYEVAHSGYLQPSTSNNSKNQIAAGELGNNAHAEITLTDGEFGVVFSQSEYSRNNLRFNSSNNPPLFSCYGSGQNPVYLYIENSGEDIQYAINYTFDNVVVYGDGLNPTLAKEGDEVSMIIYANEGSYVDAVTVTDANGDPVQVTMVDKYDKAAEHIFHHVEATFTMPASAVTVTVTSGEGLCPRMLKVNVITEHGECSIQNETDPNAVIVAGDRVRLNLSNYGPDFIISGLTVVDADNNSIEVERDGQSTFYFTMPATSVTATFSFEAVKYAITTAESYMYVVATNPENEAVAGQTVSVRAMTYDKYIMQNVLVRKVNEYSGMVGDVVFTLIPDADGKCQFDMPSHPVYLEVTLGVNLAGVSFAADRNWNSWYGLEDLALPEGVEAYVVKSVQDDVAVVESVSYIPVGVGVLLYSETSADSVVAVVSEPPLMSFPPTSLLVGDIVDKNISEGYVLYNDVFVRIMEGTLPSHRCYLPMPSSAGAPMRLRISRGDVITGVNDLVTYGNVASVTYVNVAGATSDRPFQGVNMVVTRFTDGTTKVTKVIK